MMRRDPKKRTGLVEILRHKWFAHYKDSIPERLVLCKKTEEISQEDEDAAIKQIHVDEMHQQKNQKLHAVGDMVVATETMKHAGECRDIVDAHNNPKPDGVDRTQIIRNVNGSEEPHSAEPELWNIDGAELDLNQRYKLGGQMWYLHSRAIDAVARGKPIAGRPLNAKAVASRRVYSDDDALRDSPSKTASASNLLQQTMPLPNPAASAQASLRPQAALQVPVPIPAAQLPAKEASTKRAEPPVIEAGSQLKEKPLVKVWV
jgi:hypothetical protein